MSDVKWRYFRLEGKYLEMAKEWHKERNAKLRRLNRFLRSLGGSRKPKYRGYNSQDRLRVLAIEDVGQDRHGWREYKKEPGYLYPDNACNRPREIRKAGKMWAEKLQSFSHSGPVALWESIGANSDGYTIHGYVPGRPFASWWVYPCISKIGDQYFAHIPKDADFSPPPDLPEMKAWEYLKLEDEHKQAGKAKPQKGR